MRPRRCGVARGSASSLSLLVSDLCSSCRTPTDSVPTAECARVALPDQRCGDEEAARCRRRSLASVCAAVKPAPDLGVLARLASRERRGDVEAGRLRAGGAYGPSA